MDDALDSFGATGSVLELAGGTGWWTERLARTADRLTVVDSSPEVLAINQERVGRSDVNYVVADLFDWQARFPAMTWCSSPSGSRTCQGPDLASSGRFFIHALLPLDVRS